MSKKQKKQEVQALVPVEEKAVELKSDDLIVVAAPVQRDNAKINRALIKQFKILAAERDKKMYELMEEALENYLAKQN